MKSAFKKQKKFSINFLIQFYNGRIDKIYNWLDSYETDP